MSVDHQKLFAQDKGKKVQKTIPKPKCPEPDSIQETGEPWGEHDTDMLFSLYAGLNSTFLGSRAEGVPEKSDAGVPGIPDEVRVRNVDSFLEKLGREIYEACSEDMREPMQKSLKEPMPVERIGKLYHKIYTNLSEKEKEGISPLLEEAVVTALSRVPSYLFAEKDPDHPGENDIPDIKELLALDAYLQKYEQTNPEGKASATFSGYHRGAAGQPDFVYQNEKRETMKSYDPLRLPREDSQEKWLNGAFDGHSGGKGTGAVCILDVSDTADGKLALWIKKFTAVRNAIIDAINNAINDDDILEQHGQLMHLCNTYVVSYGENADGKSVKALQKVFDDAREYLQTKSYLQQLEAWRAESSKPVDYSSALGELFGE